jgi:hypothetical protein
MKKADPKKSPPETGKAPSSNNIGKVLDIVKEVASTGNNLIDWGKEVQRTKQEEVKAYAQVAVAREATESDALDAEVRITEIHQRHFKDKMEHEQVMTGLQTKRENAASLNRQRERVLDKLLEDADKPENKAQLATSYRALLAADPKE